MEWRIKETSRQIDEEVLPWVFWKDFPNLLQDMSKKWLSGIDGEKSWIAHKIAHEKVAQMIENMDILTVELKKYIEEELASFEKHIQMKFLAVPTNHYSNQTWRKRSNKDDKTYFEVGEFFK